MCKIRDIIATSKIYHSINITKIIFNIEIQVISIINKTFKYQQTSKIQNYSTCHPFKFHYEHFLIVEFQEELSDKLNKKYPHNTGKTERSVSCGFKTIVLLLIRTTNVGMQWKYK